MNYAVQMPSDAMMYIPSLMKIFSGILKLMHGIHTDTDRQACFV
jgi:hypothetical protein